jgi:hypothetical protein
LAQTIPTERSFSDYTDVLERVSDSIFNGESVMVFIIVMIVALVLGRLVAAILRRVTKLIGDRADKTEDLAAVTQLRRLETLIVLSIAVIRTMLVIFGIYFWWVLTHEGQQPTALLGAGAVLTLVLSGALFNTLRDVAAGSVMMAEHWFGVGDHIRVEPFPEMQGVVERVTLRSTRIRKFTGEIIWVNNKDIAGITITPKGVRTIAIELFAKDHDKAVQLVEDANLRMPQGALAVVSPLTIMTDTKLGANLYHLTAICEVAPGREWLIDDFAVEVLQELDEKQKILSHDPITRYADSEAERRFARTILNARKSRTHHGLPHLPVAVARKRRAKSRAKAAAKSADK